MKDHETVHGVVDPGVVSELKVTQREQPPLLLPSPLAHWQWAECLQCGFHTKRREEAAEHEEIHDWVIHYEATWKN